MVNQNKITKKQRIVTMAHEGKSYEDIALAVGSNIRYCYQVVFDTRKDARMAKKEALTAVEEPESEGWVMVKDKNGNPIEIPADELGCQHLIVNDDLTDTDKLVTVKNMGGHTWIRDCLTHPTTVNPAEC